MSDHNEPQQVTITDIDISFGQMIVLIIKFAIACIPAALILGMFGVGAALIMAAMGLVL